MSEQEKKEQGAVFWALIGEDFEIDKDVRPWDLGKESLSKETKSLQQALPKIGEVNMNEIKHS